jgi:hypothetical protein
VAEALRVVFALAGASLVAITVVDLTGTLVVTGSVSARWRPSRVVYRYTWSLWRAVGSRVKQPERFDRWLAIYGPLSMLTLLLMWLAGLTVGWALLYRGLLVQLHGVSGFVSLLYYSGTILLSPSFGEVTDGSASAGILTLVETVMGLGSIALLISYLPVLYGAYNRREARLLTLDDPSGERIQPTSLILLHARGADLEDLNRFFAEWEIWTAEILESHVSYPMLAYFRSQHAGQSWITALGVVLDAATLLTAVMPEPNREAYMMYRRGRRAVEEISLRLHVPQQGENWLNRELFNTAYQLLEAGGLAMASSDTSWRRLEAMRGTYGTQIQSLIQYLVAPAGFWGHSAELRR